MGNASRACGAKPCPDMSGVTKPAPPHPRSMAAATLFQPVRRAARQSLHPCGWLLIRASFYPKERTRPHPGAAPCRPQGRSCTFGRVMGWTALLFRKAATAAFRHVRLRAGAQHLSLPPDRLVSRHPLLTRKSGHACIPSCPAMRRTAAAILPPAQPVFRGLRDRSCPFSFPPAQIPWDLRGSAGSGMTASCSTHRFHSLPQPACMPVMRRGGRCYGLPARHDDRHSQQRPRHV